MVLSNFLALKPLKKIDLIKTDIHIFQAIKNLYYKVDFFFIYNFPFAVLLNSFQDSSLK